jgi:hypothetical protein
MARDFLCSQGRAHTEHKLQPFGVNLASDESRKTIAVKVEARERMRVSPAQAIGQAEVDELLHLCVRGHRVGRPAESGDGLARLDADEFMPEFSAVAVEVLRDDEGAEGSVDVELCFFIFHAYRIAQRAENATIFFAIVQSIFVDEKKFWELARFMNACLRKSFIIKHLRFAAGRAGVSR